jgi:hypothetical protein
VADVGLLVAAAFLPFGSRPMLWILLSLGPLLLGVARPRGEWRSNAVSRPAQG